MIIISKRPGQLGNSIYLFIHFIAMSLERGYPLMNPAFYEYAHYFPAISADCFQRFPKKKTWLRSRWLRRLIYLFFYYSGRLIHRFRIQNSVISYIYLDWYEFFFLDKEENQKKFRSGIVIVQGWGFRCVQDVLKHIGIIRKHFEPDPKYLQPVVTLIDGARKKYDILVAVHIRHGDYAKFEEGRYFYSLEQYRDQMKQVEGFFPGKRVGFLISSNAVQDLAFFNPLSVFRPTGHEFEDMLALSYCDYIMGPPSTYSMWASLFRSIPLYMIKDAAGTVAPEDFKLPAEWMTTLGYISEVT